MRTTVITPRRPGRQPGPAKSQRGIMLLEALISIAIFSIGVLGLIGLQAAAIKNADDARQRAVAAFYGNQLISRMWADDRANLAELCAPAQRDDVRPPFRRPLCRRGIGQCERHQLA
ncbi:MAG: hypothetical protein V5B44_17400 [Candidatus Accumulibacter necessarius]|uniref:type IV pilus modification PilV family protein n=1 Tax=Candidatus Accumulibacter necessarius TaxID=2954386 RepID=UPI002FC2980F